MRGKMIIFSAPSGSGKTTMVKHLLSENSHLAFSVSACNRDPRKGEVHGKDYYFFSTAEFKRKIDAGEFVEWEEVYEGRFYGTLRSELERIWDCGRSVVFDVDVKGGLRLKQLYGKAALSVFVQVPSIQVLAERLRARSTEDEDSLQMRISRAAEEMNYANQFDVIIVNDKLETALLEAKQRVADFLAV